MGDLDIPANRRAVKYKNSELAARVLWTIVRPLFRYSPRTFFAWRRFLLRMFQAKIGRHTNIYPSANIYYPWNLEIGIFSSIGENTTIYNIGKIRIGDYATISHQAHLCSGSHDYTLPDLPLLRLRIEIRSQAWICTDAFVGPNVIVGEGAIVGARAVVINDVEPWTIVAGNPARFIKPRTLHA